MEAERGVGAPADKQEAHVSRRFAHANSCLRSTVVVRRASGAFLNKYHRAGREGALVLDIDRNSCAWVPVAQLVALVALALALGGATTLGSIGVRAH